MTQAEFIEITSEIEKFYEKEFTDEQRKIWFDELKNLTKERYRQISRECYKNLKFMPKLADIVELNGSIGKNTLSNFNNHQKIEDCNKCNGVGIVFYTRMLEGHPYEYGARCDCQNAIQWSKAIPSIQEVGII